MPAPVILLPETATARLQKDVTVPVKALAQGVAVAGRRRLFIYRRTWATTLAGRDDPKIYDDRPGGEQWKSSRALLAAIVVIVLNAWPRRRAVSSPKASRTGGKRPASELMAFVVTRLNAFWRPCCSGERSGAPPSAEVVRDAQGAMCQSAYQSVARFFTCDPRVEVRGGANARQAAPRGTQRVAEAVRPEHVVGGRVQSHAPERVGLAALDVRDRRVARILWWASSTDGGSHVSLRLFLAPPERGPCRQPALPLLLGRDAGAARSGGGPEAG